MKHDIAVKIHELYAELFNVQFDDNHFALTSIVDVDNHIVMTVDQFNNYCEPVDNDLQQSAEIIAQSLIPNYDEFDCYNIEKLFLVLLAQKNVYLVFADTDREQLIQCLRLK